MRQEGFKPSKGIVDPELSTPDRIIMRTAPASPEEHEPIKKIIDAAIARQPNKKAKNKPSEALKVSSQVTSESAQLDLDEADALWQEEMTRRREAEQKIAELKAKRDVDL